MKDLENINIVEIESITRPWRNALHHRNAIVEGIRKVASRNIVHLETAMKRCGVSRGETSGESEDWITGVQEKLLKDQGLENTAHNRELLPLATFFPVEIYGSLLYAGVEFFYESSKEIDFYKDGGMSDYLENHGEFIAELKGFRNSCVHPSVANEFSRTNFLECSPSFMVFPKLQKEFDEYLVRVQRKISEHLKNMLKRLPEDQRRYLVREYLLLYAKRIIFYKDSGAIRHLPLESLVGELSKSIDENLPTWSPDQKQKEAIARLAQCMDDIGPSGPELQYEEPVYRQTPMPFYSGLMEEFLGKLEDEPLHLNRENRHEAHIIENGAFFVELLTGVLVLLNEATRAGPLFDIGQKRMLMDDDEFAEYSESCAKKHGMQYWNEAMAPCRVALALLYEPLRIYKTASERNCSISTRKVDDYLSVRDRLETLRNFRNSVFHIWNRETDPGNVDPSMVETYTDNAFDLSVLSELLRFFLQDGRREIESEK